MALGTDPAALEIVFRAAEMLLERKEEYSRDMTREMGKILRKLAATPRKPSTRRITLQVKAAFVRTNYSVGAAEQVRHGNENPIGVCGMITPWNFPMAIPSGSCCPPLCAATPV